MFGFVHFVLNPGPGCLLVEEEKWTGKGGGVNITSSFLCVIGGLVRLLYPYITDSFKS